ncbi:hypothetical protein, partial [Enterococcus faecalis]|uniref:hypothetical protein n=1 Tax=Enterococcus faecalis TaxID=1351 RepID=UPI003D6C0374
FGTSGRLRAIEDRNGNQVTFDYTSRGALASITTDVGPADARTLEVITTGSGIGQITGITQRATDAAGNPISRSVDFGYDSS